jgi:uncharacterized glyoxalase superfamily protein PhnB
VHLKEAPKNHGERQWRRDNENLDAAAGVDGIEAFYEQCVANGVTIIKPLAATAWGTKDFYIEDPDGHIISFGGRPAEGAAVTDDATLETVANFLNRIDAELACGALQAAGISAMVAADDAAGTRPHLWMGGVRLLVRSDDVESAKAILREAEEAHESSDSP